MLAQRHVVSKQWSQASRAPVILPLQLLPGAAVRPASRPSQECLSLTMTQIFPSPIRVSVHYLQTSTPSQMLFFGTHKCHPLPTHVTH